MLTFFRKIRAALPAEGKTGKYLKYAIGEILLVVIGILIALQINNWNEYRKERIEEDKILREINRNLVIDIEAIDQRINIIQNTEEKIEKLLSLIKQNSVLEKNEMDTLFGNVQPYYLFDLNMTPFQELNAKGISIISNDSLKLEITMVYDVIHRRFEIYNSIAENASRELIRPYYFKNFSNLNIAGNSRTATPNNVEKVVNDVYYANLVEHKLALLTRQRQYYYTANKRMIKLKERIDKHFGES